MLIAIDASRITRARRTGTEAYSLRLIQHMLSLEEARRHRFLLYLRESPSPGLLPDVPNAEVRIIPFPRLWTHLRFAAALAFSRPDVTFVPAHTLPLLFPGPGVVTVHDLGYMHFPEAHTASQRIYLRWATAHSARRAAVILADSQATRRDLLRFGLAGAAKIRVVYPGADESLRPDRSPGRLDAIRRKYGLPERYLLHLGSLHPRKNLERLIEAYALWRSRAGSGGRDVGLVLAGAVGWKHHGIFGKVPESGLGQFIRFPGYVDEADLAALYTGAEAFVFPSLYEGFGFPVLEAMRCEVPVICSNTSSLPEVAGDAALLIDPTDVDAIADAIGRVMGDGDLRQTLIERGRERPRRFSWDRAAREALLALEEAAG